MGDTPEWTMPKPERIRLFGGDARVEGGVLVGRWTDELPEDMVPGAERIYVLADKADEDRRQRNRLLEAAKRVLDEFIGANEPALNELGDAVSECEEQGPK